MTLSRSDFLPVAATLLSLSSVMASAGAHAASKAPIGCFVRAYDSAHLRDHRSQQTRRLQIRVEPSPHDFGKTDFGMIVWIRGKSQAWRAGGRCEPDPKGWRCIPDTDGASPLFLTPVGRNLRLANPGSLKVSDDVTGPDLNDTSLGAPGDVSFLLMPAKSSACTDAGS